MSPASRRLVRAAGVLLVLALIAAVGAGGLAAYRHFFFDRTPAYRASEPVFQAALRNKVLTPDEFATALRLAECGERIVELRMWAAIDVGVAANPGYKPAAVALYARRAADPSDPRLQALAAKRVARLAVPWL